MKSRRSCGIVLSSPAGCRYNPFRNPGFTAGTPADRGTGMKKERRIALFSFPLGIGAGYFFADHALALFIKRAVLSERKTSLLAADIPDVLLPLVVIVTGLAWALYIFDRRSGALGKRASCALLVGTTLPLAFALKDALKFAFGRINTRAWLLHPDWPEFRCFSGAEHYHGFPSGHMAVFTVLFVAVGAYYPRVRTAAPVLLTLLALALLVTDYHFLSDILAGAYLALIIHFAALRALPGSAEATFRSSDPPAAPPR